MGLDSSRSGADELNPEPNAERYEREAQWISEHFYGKKWDKVKGKLRQDIWEMAVNRVNRKDRDGL